MKHIIKVTIVIAFFAFVLSSELNAKDKKKKEKEWEEVKVVWDGDGIGKNATSVNPGSDSRSEVKDKEWINELRKDGKISCGTKLIWCAKNTADDLCVIPNEYTHVLLTMKYTKGTDEECGWVGHVLSPSGKNAESFLGVSLKRYWPNKEKAPREMVELVIPIREYYSQIWTRIPFQPETTNGGIYRNFFTLSPEAPLETEVHLVVGKIAFAREIRESGKKTSGFGAVFLIEGTAKKPKHASLMGLPLKIDKTAKKLLKEGIEKLAKFSGKYVKMKNSEGEEVIGLDIKSYTILKEWPRE